MKFHLNGLIRRHTSDELLADLKRIAGKTKSDTVSNKTYRQLGKYCPSVITRRFGSWNNALIKAGLKVSKHYNISATELLKNLYNLWMALGRQPSLSALRPPLSRFGRRPYLRTFGKWSAALEQFAVWASKKRKKANSTFTASEYLSQFVGQTGERPNSPPVLRRGRLNEANAESAGVVDSHFALRAPHSALPRNVSWRIRYLVMKKDRFRCRACGASPATNPQVTLHIDHIIPIAKGGNSEFSNLQTLCEKCNIGKGTV